MRKSSMIAIAIGLVFALSMPVLGMTLAAPRSHVAGALVEREGLNIMLLAPLEKRTTWYGGAVIPVRIHLADPDGDVGAADVTILVDGMPGSSPGNVNMANNFTELGSGLYQFNLDTKPYPAGPGSAPIKIAIVANAPDDRSVELEKTLSLN